MTMGEKIFDIVKSFATGKKNKLFWGIVIILIILAVIILPYIDANFWYYNRIEKRVNNLSSLVDIKNKMGSNSPELSSEYKSIINEINNAQGKSLFSIFSKNNNVFEFWVKFISGGIVFTLAGIISIFTKPKSVKSFIKDNLLVFLVCIIIACILAYIFSMIPTLGNVWVNAICTPIIQFFIVYLFIKNQGE